MAKRSSRRPKAAKKPDSSSTDPASHVIDVALTLAAEKGWRDLALAEIAEAAELSLAELYALYSSKAAILAAYSRSIDSAVLAEVAAPDGDEAKESAKDRLFDLLMRRIDKLDAHKAGMLRIAEDTGRDPLSLVCSLARLDRSMAAMLEAAGISAGGFGGLLRAKGLAAVYLAGLRAWFRDDSADKAKTMAALDRALGRAERLASGLGCHRKRDAA
jgi:AcrR family transcriptional regulator